MTPTQTGDKPMVTQRAIELLERAHAKGGLGYEAHGAIEYAINVLRHRAQETLSPEQPLDTLQRLGQEFEQPTPTSRYYFCTADKTWYAKPCGDPWCRDANYQPKQGECNR